MPSSSRCSQFLPFFIPISHILFFLISFLLLLLFFIPLSSSLSPTYFPSCPLSTSSLLFFILLPFLLFFLIFLLVLSTFLFPRPLSPLFLILSLIFVFLALFVKFLYRFRFFLPFLSCRGSVNKTTEARVPGLNLLAAAVVPLGKALIVIAYSLGKDLKPLFPWLLAYKQLAFLVAS